MHLSPTPARAWVNMGPCDEHLVRGERTLTVDRPIVEDRDSDVALATVQALGEALQAAVDRIAGRMVRELEERR